MLIDRALPESDAGWLDSLSPAADPSTGRLPTRRTRAPLSAILGAHGVAAAALNALAEQLPTGLVLADGDGRVVWENSAAAGFPVERVGAIGTAAEHALLTEEPVGAWHVEVKSAGRRSRWLRLGATPLRSACDRPHLVLVTIVDETASRSAEAWEPVIESLARL